MNLMAKFPTSKGKRPSGTSSATSVKVAEPADDRAQLKFYSDELKKAEAAVADMAERVERLHKIIRDADNAHNALQAAIAADGGQSLAEYSAGRARDSEIAKLISAEETTGRAAAAAKAALANAQAALAAARAEVVRLSGLREAEILRYLTARADEIAKAYMAAWRAVCRAHDNLAGISVALSSGLFGGEIQMTTVSIRAPRFNLPASAHPTEFLPLMEHFADEHDVETSAGNWLEARQRLTADIGADIDDLVGPA